MEVPCAVIQLLVGFWVNRSPRAQVLTVAQEASEARGRAKTQHLSDRAVVEDARKNCRLVGAACQVADDPAWGDAVSGADDQVDCVHQRADVVGASHHVEPVGWEVLHCPRLAKSVPHGVNFVTADAFLAKHMPQHVVPQEPVRVHEFEPTNAVGG